MKFVTVKSRLVHLPPVSTVRAEKEGGHRLVGRSHLLLGGLDLLGFALEAGKLSLLDFAVLLVKVALESRC